LLHSDFAELFNAAQIFLEEILTRCHQKNKMCHWPEYVTGFGHEVASPQACGVGEFVVTGLAVSLEKKINQPTNPRSHFAVPEL
jgi:hypothetical protein